ncbi:MAG TPA: hypothetical protein VF756_06985 [Thermoanaerobaculia bacterium]
MVHRVLRTILVLVAILALATPWNASAAPPGSSSFREAAAPAPGLWSRATGWLTALWAEAGCIADPNGCTDSSDPGDAPADGQTDAGCIADPSGGPCRDGQ